MLWPLLLLVGAAFLGGLLAGWSGWGGWIVLGAVVWIFFSPLVALVAAQPVIVAMDGFLAWWERKFIDWSRAWRLLLVAIPGLLLGLLVALLVQEQVLYLLAAALLLCAVFPWIWSQTPHLLGAVLAGFFTTAGGWNSPPMAIAAQDLQLRSRRGTLGLVFLLLAALALPALVLAGAPKEEMGRGVVLGAMLAGPSLLGTWLGLRSEPPPFAFRMGQAVILLGVVALLYRAI